MLDSLTYCCSCEQSGVVEIILDMGCTTTPSGKPYTLLHLSSTTILYPTLTYSPGSALSLGWLIFRVSLTLYTIFLLLLLLLLQCFIIDIPMCVCKWCIEG